MTVSRLLTLPVIRSDGFRALVLSALPCAALAQTPSTDPSGGTPFSSMAIAPDKADECRAPRPPTYLAETAYVRNGYRAILGILAAEKWQETGSCECYLNEISWDEVIAKTPEFGDSSDPQHPFDVSDLRQRAEAMLAARDEACAE